MSICNCVGDWEPRTNDIDNTEEELFKEEVLNKYTGIKKKVVELLFDGLNFLEISQELKLRESQIYKIKNELAKDLRFLHDTNKHEHISSIIKLYVMGKLNSLPKKIFNQWYVDNALKEYDRPSLETIKDYIEDVLLEIAGGKVIYRTPYRKVQLYGQSPGQISLF